MSQKQNIKDNKSPYGLEKRSHTNNALRIAWRDYYNLSKEQMLDKKRISNHKRVIRKLQNNLRKPLTPFIMFEAVAWGFYKLNAELFKEDVNNDLVEKAIIKTNAILGSGMRLDIRPNMVEELIQRNNALHKYIAEIEVPNKSNVSSNTPRADEANL
jgi:hypothetical protein